MVLSDTQLQDVEKKKAILKALDQLSEQFNLTLQNLIDEKHLNTEVIPQQLHLPLGQNQSDIQDPWLKASEQCTNQTPSQS
jgi:hypothetical protein